MIKIKKLMIISIIIGNSWVYGQKLHSALQLRNSHLWRGQEVSSGFIYTGDVHLDGKNFYGGFWAGGNADGSYKEFDNYIGYKNKHLMVELWDIYNFSPGATYNNKEFFNYNASETGRFWDFRSYYTISEKLPLVLSWNTVVFGRDRDRDNTHNKYSSFVSTEYPFYTKENLAVRGRIGYAFALHNPKGEKGNFFAQEAGFNEISLIITKTFSIAGYQLPVGIWGMFNPVGNNAYLQFSVHAYSF
ncbi:hypothetical protein RAH57_19650 [Chryseobacterium sp. CKR4-1]|uniref:hypothetical protein n=1 Tax=Chryseobacterium sp. CKR4-1 TaxID=3068896 RepID=UPI0027965289|nr:hypothetical protein [Chryseobacterium sp. CKR4-1]MDQ1806209.1 hypothetical protein [Chryseobacterium sp. CKR4-1]